MGAAQNLQDLDTRMRKVFDVCRERNIKLNPRKLQCGKKVKFRGMLIEASMTAGEQRIQFTSVLTNVKLMTS